MPCKRLVTVIFILMAAGSCNRGLEKSLSKPAEAWDSANAPGVFVAPVLSFDELARKTTRRGSVNKPWSDSYWAFQKHNIAYRYVNDLNFIDRQEQLADAVSHPADISLSPAEKYDLLVADPNFAVTSESWNIYERLLDRYGAVNDEWSWMGICSGWAPASIAEVAPKEHVLAVKDDGTQVLFFNGDLRALTSKAYDINAMSEGRRTIGRRCDEKDQTIVRSSDGRIVDGRLDDSGDAFSIVSDYSATKGAIEIRMNGQDASSPTSWLLAEQPFSSLSGPAKMWPYSTRESIIMDMTEKTLGARSSSPIMVSLTFFRGCRDVNPASLHTVLVAWLAEEQEKPKSFVVEIARGHEVWNQSVWGYRTTVGRPRPLNSDTPAVRWFRAPGTTQVVDVDTSLIYAWGSRPQIAYPRGQSQPINWQEYDDSPERFGTLHLTYTLELDENGTVLGGEWTKESASGTRTPDFFWATFGTLTDQRRDGSGPSIIKFSLVRQLLACSQQAPNGEYSTDLNGVVRSLPVVICPIEAG